MLTIDMVGCGELHLPKCEQQYDLDCVTRRIESTREKCALCYNIAVYDSGKAYSNDAAVQGFEGAL